jgi:hypothetical protein
VFRKRQYVAPHTDVMGSVRSRPPQKSLLRNGFRSAYSVWAVIPVKRSLFYPRTVVMYVTSPVGVANVTRSDLELLTGAPAGREGAGSGGIGS